MSVFAAVMTGKGIGAISIIQVFGENSKDVIKKIFKSAGAKIPTFEPGKILLGTITDDNETIDQVTLGCEGPENFAINCHGNPLIVADIMKLLQQNGAELLTAEELLTEILSEDKSLNTIAIEAKLAQPKAKTLQGTKIIANQIDAGLSKTANQWLQNIDTISLEQIRNHAERILETSRTAKLIIAGCTVVIAGPPNTGKSTLLNCLCGRQKAIVTDIKGTTRDWVTGRCKIDPLSVELIDTAGLDQELAAAPKNIVEKESQERSIRFLEKADLILLVLDNSKTIVQLEDRLLEKIADKKLLTVLNKSDLPASLDTGKLPEILHNTVQISAKFNTAIENLTEKIRQICNVADFDLKASVCFTTRQEDLLKQLSSVKSKEQAVTIISELLNGQIRV